MPILLIGAAAVAAALAVIPFFIKKQWLRILLWVLSGLLLLGAGAFWYIWDREVKEKAAYEAQVRLETEELVFTAGELPEPESFRAYPNLKRVDLSEAEAGEAYAISVLKAVPEDCMVVFPVTLTDGTFLSSAEELVLPHLVKQDAEKIPYFKNLAVIDASGSSDYDFLLAFPGAFPDIELKYTVPLGSRTLTGQDTEAVLDDIGDFDLLLKMLPAFPAVEKVDLREAEASVKQILALKEAFPTTEIRYRIPIGGTYCEQTAEDLDLRDKPVTAGELQEAIPLFTALKSIDLTGTGLKTEEILPLKEAYPEIAFLYAVELFQKTYASDTETLDLRETDAKAEELIPRLAAFDELKTVYLKDGTKSDPALSELEAEYPGVLFVRNVEVFGKTVSNDIEELDISKTKVGTSKAVEDQIALLPRLKKLIMNGCGLSNEDMGGLQNAHPEVKFVWTVRIGPHNVRTDAIGFSTKNPSKYTNPRATDAYNQLVKTRKRLKEGDLENIKYCTDLEALDVGHNYLTNRDLEVLRYLPHLKVLILADNKITDISAVSCLKELQYIELFMNRIADMSPLVGLTELYDINICNTHLESIEPLKQFTQAKRLWFAMNGLTKEQNKEVMEALPNCLCNCTTTDETQEGWREHERYFWMRAYFK